MRKTTGRKIETIYEIIECVERFGGEDAPWLLLLLLALLICHGGATNVAGCRVLCFVLFDLDFGDFLCS